MVQIFGQNLGSPFAIVDTEGRLYVNASISGGIHIGSVSANVDSIYVQSGNNIIGSMYVPAGSVIVTNTVSTSGTSTIAGSVYSTGSINISTDLAQIGSYAGVGSIIGSVYQLTNPWIVSGTSTIAGSTYVTGSINLVNQLGSTLILSSPGSINVTGSIYTIGSINIVSPSTIGSYTSMALGSVAITNIGSVIQYTNPWIILGSIATTNSGSVIQSTNPWIISGNVLVSGTVQVYQPPSIGSFTSMALGSVAITNNPSIYVQSGANIIGSFYPLTTTPTLVSSNPLYKLEYVTSGTSTGVTGSEIGSITQFLGTGSYVKVITWSNNFMTQVGSWV